MVGVLTAKGQGGMGDQDDVVVLPLHTLQRRVTGSRRVNTLLVSMEDGSAVVLSALGGVVGIVIATAASWGLSNVMGVPYLLDPAINALSLLFSAAIGVLFGYLPARRAARMDPIEALRHE